ncbi:MULTISPECIES: D-lactate dehydrogenase [unclassified Novosphingobium]|uniref:D-lactate dehydrogenase n=1 Tax=unclassified Novosphingobium TaxID=2644732 RepID=UPI001494DEAC|nr:MULTISPECIES: D-lactate dehydrogenase [unclassified Novosphingobium]MBB3359593.1 D-lactate dehydrogenase [Novosphingobium sp. BK256]MBB3376041.1 D-lactate dehydrogenase [Novosphingobium sp. BK280]MBB3380366.1 D-lactate dehydrogenase [Novosphingobium sp. BK258]MBB3422018.1 D-lactate dehydrogenase [Novosphingobium sp. BK267]MBB3450805.1 D-lactate dehydrogenase [Novosphingobium sp. BK352]
MLSTTTPLLDRLRAIVGARHVLTGCDATRAFATGYRYGNGDVLAVVRPGTPLEQYHAFCACIAADVIVIAQAANTGLTGGSTPHGHYDRPVVIINTLRLKGVHALAGGTQVVCLAGATLYDLERELAPLGREPHSVIGSSCIGASVIGGICNNSGGALIRRGPAYTEMALFARVMADGTVELVNHLGLDLGTTPEDILGRIGQGRLPVTGEAGAAPCAASCQDYAARVRDIAAPSPARYNADPERLFEASGSAGKVMVFAVRLDTFPREEQTATFYIGTNDTAELTRLRRTILAQFRELPISGEYIHRDAFDIAAVYGKDVFVAIERFGTDRLPRLFALKNRIDAVARRWRILPANLSDRVMQAASRLLPQHLPPRMRAWRDRFTHHLILKMPRDGVDEARTLLAQMFPSATGDMFECTPHEAQKAFLHRFAVAGAAIRYRAIHADRVGDIVALDIALRRNDEDWLEVLPSAIADAIEARLYYGHFFCHVFHQDYILKKGVDPLALEHRMWDLLDARGAEYPAEHNVGHLYPAKPALAAHYRALDPGNRLNPGIGQTSRQRDWQ